MDVMSKQYDRRMAGSSFSPDGSEAGGGEYYFTFTSPGCRTFRDELSSLLEIYTSTLVDRGLDTSTLAFARFYLSDISNQKEFLRKSELFEAVAEGAVSTIQQCPLNGGHIALLTYHVIPPSGCSPVRIRKTHAPDDRRTSLLFRGAHYSMMWMANFFASCECGTSSYEQTKELFQTCMDIYGEENLTLLDNVLRTWIYVRDIDNNYHGMVKARRELFMRQGLSADTRYIASTGIEGFMKEYQSLVSMDMFALGNLDPGQIVRMNALDNMPMTIDYGVTFDRGTRVRFGDRSHLYISGTASIDPEGLIMYPGDVRRQTIRAIDNVSALLHEQGASIVDMAYMLVYVRNMKDGPAVREILAGLIPESIPVLILVGSVCRPAWLVEIEGVAIIPDQTEYPPFF